MNGVEYRLGSENISNIPTKLFSDESCSFIAELSSTLLKSKKCCQFPDVITLAYWCRRGNIQKIKNNSEDISRRIGRGLCFQFSSPNVATNFAYSWLISLLAGNANIVKLPEKMFPQVEHVLEAIRISIKHFPAIDRKTAFVQYASCEKLNALFSAISDARMIWGGNKIIAQMKKLVSKPRCVDVAFADRYSVCIINGQAVCNASNFNIKRLAEDFYNDTYLVDQNANSSPQLILWVNDCESARERFWNTVYQVASAKYELKTSFAVDKYVQMCEDAIVMDNISSVKRTKSLLYRVELESLKQGMEKLRGIGGYFYEYSLGDMRELCGIVSEKFQTITQFGMDSEALRNLVIDNNLPGIDRIAPIGKAMDLSIIWDGYNLINMLSRIVNVE